MTTEAVTAVGPGAPRGSVATRVDVAPSGPAPSGPAPSGSAPSGPVAWGPVAWDAALVEVMAQGARTAAAAEGMALAAVAGLVLGRQEAAREQLLTWRREHPDHRSAREAWDVAAADCEESVAGEVADEVAAALRLSRRTARARVDLAVDLATIAPATFTALRSGVLDVPRARRIVEALGPVHAEDPALAARIETEILSRAPDRTAAQVAASARRAVLRHARQVAGDATEQAHRQRCVGIEHGCDPSGRDAGQASLRVSGRADRVQAAFTNLTRAARAHLDTHPQETRTLDQVRADLALTALLRDLRTGRLRTDDPGPVSGPDPGPDPAPDPGPDPGPDPVGNAGDPDTSDPTRVPDPPVTVHLVLPLATLAGGDEPGELLGHGPIPAPLARDLLLRTQPADGPPTPGPRIDGPDPSPRPHDHPVTVHPVTVLLREDVTFTRWLTDSRGVVTATPASTYRPPAGTARTVRARDLTCRFPGCRTPAHRCDLDHTVPWPRGETSPANLAAVCRGHHDGKTTNRWAVTLDPATAALTWTAPTGHTYTTHPPTWPEGP